MNILHLRSSEFYGGPEKAIIGQCQAMRDYNFTCASFVRSGRPNDFLEKCASRSIKTLALPQHSIFDISPIGLLRNAVSERRVDILVSHDYKSNLFGALALRGSTIVQVAHFRGRTDEDAKVRLYNLLDRYVLRRVDHVFVVCRAAKNLLARQGINALDISVVPNGMDCTMPLRQPAEVTSMDAQAPMPIIAAGRLSKEKGFDILVEAAVLLDRAGFNFHMRIFGSGPERKRLQSQITEARLAQRISLSGFTDDLAARMREARILAIPSRSEGMPNVLLEAWAAGLAVVATPVGGIPEMIDHRVNGILSDEVTPQSLSAALSEALSKPEHLRTMALGGQAKLKSHFSFERQADLLSALYPELGRPASAGPGARSR